MAITSATVDPDIFVRYFGGENKCPVLKVSGRTFPVDVFWDNDESEVESFPNNYEEKALKKALELHKNLRVEEGNILVFLTSAVETERCVERFRREAGKLDNICLKLHGRLTQDEQQLVFKAPPKGKRKVVFSTNSAETSITIDGVRFVIDTVVVKEMRFDPRRNISSLEVVTVSQSSANQRKGRAGRTSSGKCYRLYSEDEYNQMEKTGFPEILRIQVSQAILKSLELEVNPFRFEYVQAPSTDSMRLALDQLKSIGAINRNGLLTEEGKWIAKMPVEPKLGMMIKRGLDLGIPLETIVVACSCTQSGIFYRGDTPEEKQMSDMRKLKFCNKGGDLLTILDIYRIWDKQPEKEKDSWCKDNSINDQAMKRIREMTNELITIHQKESDSKIKHAFLNPDDAEPTLRKLVFDTMKNNLAFYLGHSDAGYMITNRQQRVKIHPFSTVISLGMEPTWVVFNKVLKTSEDFITEVSSVNELCVKEATLKREIDLDISLLQTYCVKKSFSVLVGAGIYCKFVGRFNSNRKQVEEEIKTACRNSVVIIETNKTLGEIALFCTDEFSEIGANMLNEKIKEIKSTLKLERIEEPLIKTKQLQCATRAVLGMGGGIVSILQPTQFRSLKIIKTSLNTALSKDTIKKELGRFGEIE